MATRKEHDSFGEIEVDESRLWGAQTQRSLLNFCISTELMPPELIVALAQVKAACAQVNTDLGRLEPEVGRAVQAAAQEVASGLHMAEFPLRVWQTGSGTQTNMNMNEVLANLASQRLGGEQGASRRIHPNDHVNKGQSSNDIYPTAMHVATVVGVRQHLLPALATLKATMAAQAARHASLIKMGRTHLQDAVPLTLGQELSAFVTQLGQAEHAIRLSLGPVHELAVGGTAVGTGLNTTPDFGPRVAAVLTAALGQPFTSAADKFAALAAHDGLVQLHGSLKTLAVALMKIANDLRWLASGPRSGLGELSLPENEPGSSIMPGKVNPTQCEALTMLCAQVMGNDVAVSVAGAGGQLQLNTFKPVMAHNLLQSIRLLADGMTSFEANCVRGMQANTARIADLVGNSLMLVTALAPHLGYDRAAAVAHKAHHEGLSLRQAALELGVAADDFDRWVRPQDMLGHASTHGRS